MKNKLITLTTDYGDSFSTSQLEAVIYELGFDGKLIENHDVKPYSIIEGAYGIWQLAKFCPPGTIHVGVVDPGVGSNRFGIVIKTKNFWFVGPDNGLFWPAASADEILEIWKLDETLFENVRTTIHGRDIFVKQAVYLTQGELPRGTKIQGIQKFEFQDGQVVHIDAYGNAKIWGEKTFGLPVSKTFVDVPIGSPLVYQGSSDLLEIAINQGNAKERFGLKLGKAYKNLNNGRH